LKTIEMKSGAVVLLDDEDHEVLSAYRWFARPGRHTCYAMRKRRVGGKDIVVLMHRQIMAAPAGLVVDHIDGNGLNNQRSNLRLCTSAENIRNQPKRRVTPSRYKGVFVCGTTGRWFVKILAHNRQIFLGRFASEHAAARAYNEAAQQFFGEFANLNVIDGEDRFRRAG
jgi:hypothetical protein